MTDLIRTKRDGCFDLRSTVWGAFLSPTDDPLSNAELEPGALESFELHEGIAPIPADIWSRWVKLCFHYAKESQSNTEVSCRLLRHEDDKSQWRLLIPNQAVSGGSVRISSFDFAVDIVSGEVIEQYPPAGWVPCGSSHSHNTMTLDRFSATDDEYELGDPGLHIVISHIDHAKNTYVPTASVTANKRRFYLPKAAAVIDLAPTDFTYHPKVLDVVQLAGLQPLLGAWPSAMAAAANRTAASRGRQGKQPALFTDDAFWFDDMPMRQTTGRYLGGSGPIAAAEEIRELAIDVINDCLMSGDDFGVDHLLWNLRDLIDELQKALHCDDPNATTATNTSTLGAYPGAAGGLPPGDW